MIVLIIQIFLFQNHAGQPLPAPGKKVDVGGFRLHFYQTGQTGPTVVLLPGSGDIGLVWNPVQKQLSDEAIAVSVDYAGLGWSEFGPPDRGLTQESYEVHTLLKTAGLKPPYLLVGHSYGGLLALRLAHDFPGEVSGIVLVDASTPDLRLKYREGDQFVWDLARNRAKKRPVPAVIFHREIAPEVNTVPMERQAPDLKDFEPEIAGIYREFLKQPMVFAKGQRDHLPEELRDMAASPHDYFLGELPLAIISANASDQYQDDPDEAERWEWRRQSRLDLAAFSSKSKLFLAEHSGHMVHLDQPDLVVSVIRDMISALK